jgi:6-phosphogluconolactonase (cycloisomerase 2 family)
MVTGSGIVENYDIEAAVTKQIKTIPDQSFTKIAVDHYNQFIIIASYSGNLYKFDTE